MCWFGLAWKLAAREGRWELEILEETSQNDPRISAEYAIYSQLLNVVVLHYAYKHISSWTPSLDPGSNR